MQSVVVLSFIPSPYQVELFDAIHDSGRISLKVIYAARGVAGTPWSEPAIRHDHRFVSECDPAELLKAVREADLAVFSWYRDPTFRRAMRERARCGNAWCLWSERPGFRHTGAAGRALRKVLLWPLWTSNAAIWGIGHWAIEGYQKEF